MTKAQRHGDPQAVKPDGRGVQAGPSLSVLTIALLVAGIALRLFQYISNRSLWLDEAMLARNILDRSPIELLAPLDYDQGAPVLFLLLVDAATILFGSTELALRLVPLLASAISLPLFFIAARFYLDRRYIPIAVCVFVFSPPLVYYAQEAKQYSMDVAVALTLACLLLRIAKSNGPRRTGILFLGFIGSIAVFLSHPAVFVLAAIAGTLIVLKASNRLDVSLLSLGFVVVLWVVCFGGNYLFFLQSLSASDALYKHWSGGFLPLPLSIDAIKTWLHSGMRFLSFAGYLAQWQVFVVALAGVSVSHAIATRSATTLMMGLIFIVTLSASVIGAYPFSGRLGLYLIPFVILLVVRGLQILSQGKAKAVYVILTLCLLAPPLYSLGSHALHPIQKEEVRPLLQYLHSHRQRGDQVYVYYGASRAVRYYHRIWKSKGDFFHHGTQSRNDRSKYIEDIDAMKKWQRVWFLFGHFHKDEEAFFLMNIDGVLLEKHKAVGASLYLYRFENQSPTS